VWSLVSFPLLCLVSILGGWSMYSATRRHADADRGKALRRILALLPCVSLIGCVASVWLLGLVCHGNFGCR
jgi:hypothetical protein